MEKRENTNHTIGKTITILAAVAVLLAACSLTPAAAPTNTPPPPPPQQPTDTMPPADQDGQPAPTEMLPPDNNSLPAAVYLLSQDENVLFQVYRISQDRSTITKITAEPENVGDYAVNSITGQIAYITNNQIYVINSDTSGRTLLVDGSGANQNQDSFYYREKISGLAWSNDGTQLAYGRNGLNILTIADNTSQNIVENVVDELDNNMVIPREIYSPFSWSPDGSLLLVDIGFIEGGSLGIFDPAKGTVTQLGEGIVCCHPTWSPDSRSIVVASPYLGMIASGLWRYDVNTGAVQELIPTTSEDNTLNFAGWPLVLPNGQLQFFYSNMVDFPTGDTPLVMIRTDADGQSNRTIIRNEEWIHYEVLWSPDGRLALSVQPAPGEDAGWPRTGPVVLIPASEDAIVPLGINGYMLQWGP